MVIFCGHREAKMMNEGDFELHFNFDLEFLNNRRANRAQTRTQSDERFIISFPEARDGLAVRQR